LGIGVREFGVLDLLEEDRLYLGLSRSRGRGEPSAVSIIMGSIAIILHQSSPVSSL
jgi:hypothetical protein